MHEAAWPEPETVLQVCCWDCGKFSRQFCWGCKVCEGCIGVDGGRGSGEGGGGGEGGKKCKRWDGQRGRGKAVVFDEHKLNSEEVEKKRVKGKGGRYWDYGIEERDGVCLLVR